MHAVNAIGIGEPAVALVSTLVNGTPTAQDDEFTVAEDSGATAIDLLANDSDPDGDALSIFGIVAPSHGAATLDDNGTPADSSDDRIRYTPAASYFGADAFQYTISDGEFQTSALVSITVTAVNDPPVAGNDSIVVPESGSLAFEARANDSPGPANEAAQALTVQAITQAPADGTASVGADGRIVYTPTPGFDGADSFVYRVCDEGTTAGDPDPRCDEATVAVDVEGFDEQLEEIIDTSPGPVADKLEDALEKIAKAEQKLAQTPPDRQGALGEYEGAVGEIEAAVKDGVVSAALGRSLMDRVCAFARKVADDAIVAAETRGGNAGKITEARQYRGEGDARRSAGQFKDAVSKYKDAVSKADGA